jgi:hypothetical protein
VTYIDFASALLAYCQTLGGSVTRWISTERHNLAVGGDARSLHLIGLAADIVYDSPPPIERARGVAEQLGLYVYREGDHDHLRVADRTWV